MKDLEGCSSSESSRISSRELNERPKALRNVESEEEMEWKGDAMSSDGKEGAYGDGGFVSRVSTLLENYHKESTLLNEEIPDVPIYNDDLLDPIQPLSRAATNRVSKLESEEETIEDDGQYNADDILDPPPDGGYGWVCCVCVIVMNYCTWGPNTCYGVFLSYYLSSDYFHGGTPTDFALIGGLMLGLTLFLLPLSALCMNKFGYRPVMMVSVVMQCVAFISSSFAKTIGELYFTYGIMLGFANGFIFGCNSVVIPGWFLKKRALANGLTHIGVGLGGLTLTFAVHAMIDSTGSHKWAMRMLGIMCLVLNSIAAALVKVRKPKVEPPKRTSLELLKDVYDFKIYRLIPLQYCTGWATLTNIGYVILLFSLSNYALSIGLSSQQATNTLAVFNGAQIIGRPAMGYFSEKVGRVNFTIVCMIYSVILIGPYWFNITTYGAIMPFAFLLGLGAGVCSVNTIPLIADVTGLLHFPAGLGYNNIWNGCASLAAEIIALRLRNYSLSNPYLHCQIFVLCMYFGGMLLLIPYREWKVTRMLKARISHKGLDEDIREKWTLLLQPGIINYARRAFYLIRA